MKETITKDHVKSGRAGIYDELRAWPTTVCSGYMHLELIAAGLIPCCFYRLVLTGISL